MITFNFHNCISSAIRYDRSGRAWAIFPHGCFTVHERNGRSYLIQQDWASCPFDAQGKAKRVKPSYAQ